MSRINTRSARTRVVTRFTFNVCCRVRLVRCSWETIWERRSLSSRSIPTWLVRTTSRSIFSVKRPSRSTHIHISSRCRIDHRLSVSLSPSQHHINLSKWSSCGGGRLKIAVVNRSIAWHEIGSTTHESHNMLSVVLVHKFIGVCRQSAFVYLVTEFMDQGDLRTHLKSSRPLPWSWRLSVAADVARGIAFLHSKKIMHRYVHNRATHAQRERECVCVYD
jgi:hypothetical protein